GTTPFDKQRFATAAFDEIRRIIREEEPPTPSTRLSTLGAGLVAMSAQRKIEPGKLSALLRNELDWIVMKALEKDRTRRYETANGLAADVLRFLSGEPVQAHPPSASYRLKKFVRKNRGQVAAAAVVFAVLVAGVVGTGLGSNSALLDLLNRAADKLKARKDLDPRTEAELCSVIGSNYQHVGEDAKGVPFHERALELQRAALGEDHHDTLVTMNQLATS